MPDSDHPALFIAAGLLLNITPGPDVMFIVSHAMRSGLKAGAVAALGITAGCFVHIVAAALGISALLATSTTAFTVLKWIGALYLFYVGVSMLRAKRQRDIILIADGGHPTMECSHNRLDKVFLKGFATNALNPKVALFFLAFVPQFIAPEAPDKTVAFLLLGLIFNINGLWVNLGWAWAAVWARKRLATVRARLDITTRWLDRIAGTVFVGFGLKLAFSESPQP